MRGLPSDNYTIPLPNKIKTQILFKGILSEKLQNHRATCLTYVMEMQQKTSTMQSQAKLIIAKITWHTQFFKTSLAYPMTKNNSRVNSCYE